MSKKTFCDICGKEVDEMIGAGIFGSVVINEKVNFDLSNKIPEPTQDVQQEYNDLCKNCTEKIKEFIKTIKV